MSAVFPEAVGYVRTMPSRSHHVACTTDDPAAVEAFLTDVVGLPVYLRFWIPGENLERTAGWPPNEGTDAVLYGDPPGGLVEVIAVPEALRGRVPVGLWLVSFATADLEAMRDAAKAGGVVTTEPFTTTGEVRLDASFTTVGGVPFELVRFLT